MSEVEVRTPDRRAAPPCPCCTGFCGPFVREYTDERRVWWVVTPCGTDYRIDDSRLQWQRRDPLSGEWLPDGPPELTFLDGVLGRENDRAAGRPPNVPTSRGSAPSRGEPGG